MEKSGFSHSLWKREGAGSNPAIPTSGRNPQAGATPVDLGIVGKLPVCSHSPMERALPCEGKNLGSTPSGSTKIF